MHRKRASTTDEAAFTLMELVVVVALISIVLVFALPRVGEVLAGRSTDRLSRWICRTSRQLRTEAIRTHTQCQLRIDMDAQRIWWEKGTMSESEGEKAKEAGLILSEKVRIADVVYADGHRVSTEVADIRFHPAGYADLALIHIAGPDAEKSTLRISPFLPRCRQQEGAAGLSDWPWDGS